MRLISFFLLLTTSLSSWATDFDALWKKVQENNLLGNPQKAISVLDEINKHAKAENKPEEQMPAEFCRALVMGTLSADSLQKAYDELSVGMREAEKLTEKSERALQALRYIALAEWIDEVETELTKEECFERALRYPEVLSECKSVDYKRIITVGKDDDLFAHDLLSFIAHRAKRYDFLYGFYKERGNLRAACIELSLMVTNGENNGEDDLHITHAMTMLKEGMETFKDVPEVALLATAYADLLSRDDDVSVETRYNFLAASLERYEPLCKKANKNDYLNAIRRQMVNISRPRFDVTLNHTKAILSLTNINSLSLRLFPLSVDGTFRITKRLTKSKATELKKKVVGKETVIDRAYSKPLWKSHRDTLDIPAIPYGIYLIEATAPEVKEPVYELFYHSDLTVLNFPVSKEKSRVVVVSSTTGEPIANASVKLYRESYKSGVGKPVFYTTNSKGEVVVKTVGKDDKMVNRIWVSTPSDKGFCEQPFHSSFYNEKRKEERDILSVFTDRAIYRPGQTVKGVVVVHNAANEDNIHVVAGKRVKVEIFDANLETLFTDSLTTDEMGHASFECTLPKELRNGRGHVFITGENSVGAWSAVSFEEYRRPTFEVTVKNRDDFKEVVLLGEGNSNDTARVAVLFNAKQFVGLPVQNAKVKYSVRRTVSWFLWRGNGSSRLIAKDVEAETDDNGMVAVPIEISLPEFSRDCFNYTVQLSVTAGNGESQEASFSLRAARKGWRWQWVENKEIPEFELSHSSFPASGKVMFSMRKPTGEVKSSQKAYYTFVSENEVVESGECLFDTLYTREIQYKKKYGEGLCLMYSWVSNGVVHSFSETIKKPKKDLLLNAVWKTFRDKTVPDGEEKWELYVSGKGTRSALVATLYDKSLDALVPHVWNLNVLQNSFYLYSDLEGFGKKTTSLNGSAVIPTKNQYVLKFSTLDQLLQKMSMYYSLSSPNLSLTSIKAYGRAPLLTKAEAATEEMKEEASVESADVMVRGAKVNSNKKAGSDAINENTPVNENTTAADDLSKSVRKTLGESALFLSSAMADNEGVVSLNFRMPETVTTWRFLGIVHDEQMNYSIIDTVCVARKEVLVQPNIPVFLRSQDKAVFRTSVQNVTEEDKQVEVIMQLLSPSDETVLWQEKKTISVKALGTQTVAMEAISIPYISGAAASNKNGVVLRVVAREENGNSDGEQHFIPVLPDTEDVTLTLPFTQRKAGIYSYDLSKLLLEDSKERTMRVKYTDCVENMLLDAIPATVNPTSDDALSLASALYVKNMFSLDDSLGIASKLQRMQNAEGEWSWWKGMNGSVYVTAAVSRLLARLSLCKKGDELTRKMLSDAMPSLITYLQKEVEEIKKERKGGLRKTPSQTAFDILYIVSVMKYSGFSHSLFESHSKDIDFMLSKLQEHANNLTIYGKAHAASIFAMNGKKAIAVRFLESMKEYTVYSEEAGRYYESPKALFSWRNYRIPTQVAAIEALHIVSPDDKVIIEEMQRWLLHEKRTQQWNTSVNTADAIHAFLFTRESSENTDSAPAVITYHGKALTMAGEKVREAETKVVDGAKLQVSKSSDTTSWGAAYISQKVNVSNIEERKAGFAITREILSLDGKGKAAGTSAGNPIGDSAGNSVAKENIGKKVVVRITVKADRDYDFVEVADSRMASLAPVAQLSGYCHASAKGTARGAYSGYYRVLGDNETRYYFDHMAKGTHVIETEYFLDREGNYSSGSVSVRCVYADEFSALNK